MGSTSPKDLEKERKRKKYYLRKEKYIVNMGHALAALRYDPKTCDLQVGFHVRDIDRCSQWLYDWGQKKFPDRFKRLGHMAVDHGMVMSNNRMWATMEKITPEDFRDFLKKLAAMYVIHKVKDFKRIMR